jgi:hypothetical protein
LIAFDFREWVRFAKMAAALAGGWAAHKDGQSEAGRNGFIGLFARNCFAKMKLRWTSSISLVLRRRIEVGLARLRQSMVSKSATADFDAPSRRTATNEIVPASILRDARIPRPAQERAPVDEVRGFELHLSHPTG